MPFETRCSELVNHLCFLCDLQKKNGINKNTSLYPSPRDFAYQSFENIVRSEQSLHSEIPHEFAAKPRLRYGSKLSPQTTEILKHLTYNKIKNAYK
jgi:hypothetical protein